MVKRPASALDNPVRESLSLTASQRAKVILNTPANGVSTGEVCFVCCRGSQPYCGGTEEFGFFCIQVQKLDKLLLPKYFANLVIGSLQFMVFCCHLFH